MALVLSMLATPALAQGDTTSDATFGEKIAVEEVLLDVVVTDGQGKMVTGLDRDDFIVREDGKPATILDVTFYAHEPSLAASATEASEMSTANRYFILFFHHQRTLLPRLGANLLDAGHRAKQWVKSSLGPNDYVAVVSYFPKYHLLDFTRDVDVLTATIDEAVQGKSFTAKESERPEGIASLALNLPEGDVDRIYEALAMTAEAAGEVRGRKNLVLFSIGFGEIDTFGFYRPDTRYYPEMIRTLNDNNVAVYPVDLLATDLSPLLRTNRFQHVLSRMAIESGGDFFFNFTNYLTPLEQTAEENKGYYLLSFAPTEESERGTYREVEVETLDSNLDVRAREGYVTGDVYPYGDS